MHSYSNIQVGVIFVTKTQSKIQFFLSTDTEYYEIVKPILEHPEILKRKTFVHHESCSVYEHCLIVSIISYLWAKRLNWDYRSAAIGGLLHDFYDEPWQTADHKAASGKKKLREKHGFVHARQAAKNAAYYFPELVTEKVDNIIRRHMFPLNIVPPKYREAWIVTMADKYTSLDVFKSPKEWPKYLGLSRNRQS